MQIRHKETGAVLFQALGDSLVNADLQKADLMKADLRWADLHKAILHQVDLRWADLRVANLSGADLQSSLLYGADLSCADLAGANLRCASFTHANLREANFQDAILPGADFRDADLTGVKGLPAAPIILNIDQKILDALKQGGHLDMFEWHSCSTTHCRAGWAVHLAGPSGYVLEALTTPYLAGRLIYEASRPGVRAPNFFADEDEALEDLKESAEAYSK